MQCAIIAFVKLFRSSRPDYIETPVKRFMIVCDLSLFRSSRPDYIETQSAVVRGSFRSFIVPVFQAGLH